MKQYNLNKCLWGIFLCLLFFAFTGCDDDDEFSDLNPDISWNIDKDKVLRLEDYTGNLGADAKFYDVDEDLMAINYDEKTNSHIITPKNIGGNNFYINVKGRKYHVHMKIFNKATDHNFYFTGMSCVIKGEGIQDIEAEIEEELYKRNYFFDKGIRFTFSYKDSYATPSLRYSAKFINESKNESIEYDLSYNIETKEFTITDRDNKERSMVVYFRNPVPNYQYFSLHMTEELKEKYGEDKVDFVCLYLNLEEIIRE